MILNKEEIKNFKITNFTKTVQSPREKELQKKIKENEKYIEYIKENDKKAYERYLSYSTYLSH